MAERYNGWANYETWCVNLHLSNDEGDYNYWRDEAREAARYAKDQPGPLTEKEQAEIKLADNLRDTLKDGELSPLGSDSLPGMYRDLLKVHWGEVAKAFLEDLEEYESLDTEEVEEE